MAKWEQAPIIDTTDKPKWMSAPLSGRVLTPQDTLAPLDKKPVINRPLPNMGFGPTIRPIDVPDVGGLGIRGLKQFANILPETAKETLYGLGGGRVSSFVTAGLLNRRLKKMGIKAPSLRETQKLIKQKTLKGMKIPEFEVVPPITIGEKAVDIVTGVGKFVTKLALLKKVYPNISGGALWEMENLSSGGTPGVGYTMHGVFSAPGKLIKGATKVARVERLAAESAGLAGLTALEQKIDTGELDWQGIAVSAALPVALRTPGAIKKLIRARHPKVMKAITKAHPELMKKQIISKEPITKSEREALRKMGMSIEEIGKTTPEQLRSKLMGIKPTIDTANKEIQAWSKKAKLLNKTERKASVKALRKQQAARGKERYKLERAAGTPRLEAFKKARKAYGGRAAVPEIEPLKLTPEQQDFYGSRIERVYPETQQFQRTGAAGGLEKMQTGRIPTNYEFGLLEPILGRDTTKKLYMDLIKKRPFSGWEVPALVIQGFKTKFGFDIQMFRQARSLAIKHPILYLKSSAVNARAYLSNKYAEKTFAAVQNSPGYAQAEKLGWNFVGEAGYSSKRLEYYSLGLTERLLVSKSKFLRGWGRVLEASERGAVAGINTMQKGLYDIVAKNVRQIPNITPAKQKLYMKNYAKTHNTFMKILRVPPGKEYQGLRRLKQVANYLLFSPSMTASRPLQIKVLLANKGSRGYAAQVIASNIASIYAITAIPTIIGHQMRLQNPGEEPDVNGELNVLDSNWGKIRKSNTVFDFSGGDAPFYRTLARIGVSAYMYGKEQVTGKDITEFAGKRVPNAGDTIQRYVETRETAALGYAKTMLTGKDWMGEPIPRLEATARALSPEIIEAVIEAGMADGTWGSIAAFAGASTSVGVSTYPVHAAATRSKFRDIVSQAKHGTDWDELSMSEQNRLRSEHRTQFDVLSERIRKERIEKPMSIEKIKEEELRSSKRIKGMLSKSNRQWIEDISIGVSRRPKNYYLNDKRYNRYQELIVQYVDERLSKVDFTDMEEKKRIARVQVIVKTAKNRALTTLRREISGK